MQKVNKFATAEIVLATAVTNTSTFTVSYPSGTSQLSFNAGLSATGSYIIINDNDKFTEAASKISVSYDASYITVTNSTGATLAAGTKVRCMFERQDGGMRIPLTLPLPSLSAIAADGDVVTEIRPGIAGYVEHVEFVTTVPASTASKLATLNLEIDTTNVTGGTVALTTAACNTLGKVVVGAAITGNNRLTETSKLSVEASSVTAFVEGGGYLLVYIRPDLPDAY